MSEWLLIVVIVIVMGGLIGYRMWKTKGFQNNYSSRSSLEQKNGVRVFAYFVVSLSLISSILFGFASITAQEITISINNSFNFNLFFIIFIAGIGSSAVFFAIAAVIDRLNILLAK